MKLNIHLMIFGQRPGVDRLCRNLRTKDSEHSGKLPGCSLSFVFGDVPDKNKDDFHLWSKMFILARKYGASQTINSRGHAYW